MSGPVISMLSLTHTINAHVLTYTQKRELASGFTTECLGFYVSPMTSLVHSLSSTKNKAPTGSEKGVTSHVFYRVIKKSVNLKHSLALTGRFRFKPANQFEVWYHSIVNCELNIQDLSSNNLYVFNNNVEIYEIF
jgi:hypothetical protein